MTASFGNGTTCASSTSRGKKECVNAIPASASALFALCEWLCQWYGWLLDVDIIIVITVMVGTCTVLSILSILILNLNLNLIMIAFFTVTVRVYVDYNTFSFAEKS